MTLPAFLIAGASFSGAEMLHALLKENPALFFPPGKPGSFFYRSDLYARGTKAYESLFQNCDPHRLPGDIGVAYFERGITLDAEGKYQWRPQDDCAFRIKKHCPHAKIVLCLRNPLKRMELQFRQARAGGGEKAPDLDAALQEELSGKRAPENHPLCYLYRNRYADHAAHWKRLFGAGNLHITLYEDFSADIEKELARVESFIGVRPHAPDALAVAQAQGMIPERFLPAFEIAGRFATLRPLLVYGLSRFTPKPSTAENPPPVPAAVSDILAQDRAQLETITGLSGLDALWAAPSGK